MRVRVKEGMKGFYEYVRRRSGDVFDIPDTPRRKLFPGEERFVAPQDLKAVQDGDGMVPQLFSFKWMEPVDPATPTRITTAQQSVTQQNETTKQELAASKAAPQKATGANADVL